MLCCLHKSFYKKCPKNHVFAKQKKQRLRLKPLGESLFQNLRGSLNSPLNSE